MGIVTKKTGAGISFLKINAKDGTISTGKKDEAGNTMKDAAGKTVKEVYPAGTNIHGIVRGFTIKEEPYEGNTNYVLSISMDDPEEGAPRMQVDAHFGSKEKGLSAFGLGLLSRLNSADLSQPLDIQPKFEGIGSTYKDKAGATVTRDKDSVSTTVWQNRKPCKALYADGSDRLPPLPRNSRGAVSDTVLWDPIGDALVAQVAEKFSNLAPEEDEHGIDVNDVAGGAERASAPRQ